LVGEGKRDERSWKSTVLGSQLFNTVAQDQGMPGAMTDTGVANTTRATYVPDFNGRFDSHDFINS
jgi:hypothetical protein